MNGIRSWIAIVVLLVVITSPTLGWATNGYFIHGVGVKAKGMAGAAIALPQDALAGGYNPAGMAFVGNRFDLGLDWFRPDRGSEITGNANVPLNGQYDANDKQNFLVPELGVNKMLTECFALGLSVYGHGGMSTSYTTAIGLFGTTNPGVDLSQLFIVPTLAVKLNEDHSLGLSLNLAWQRFKATGLENFDNAMLTSGPGKVTNNDYDSSTGFGVRMGWMGHFGPVLTVGATYQSRTFMGEFEEYKGLFAEEGDFDIPSAFGVGVALAAGKRATLAFDVKHIRYSEVNAVANPLLPNLGQAPLGDEDGAGFGWEDVTAYKLGLACEAGQTLTLRGGLNYGKQPIPESETLFNILAPGVVETHATLGATWTLPNGGEISLAYMHAFEKTVEGSSSIVPGAPPQGMGGGEADLTMFEDSLGLAFGMGF